MEDLNTPESDQQDTSFASQASEESPGIIGEFIDFLRHNKKWWLLPILLALLLFGILIALGGTAAAPFIYTLF